MNRTAVAALAAATSAETRTLSVTKDRLQTACRGKGVYYEGDGGTYGCTGRNAVTIDCQADENCTVTKPPKGKPRQPGSVPVLTPGDVVAVG